MNLAAEHIIRSHIEFHIHAILDRESHKRPAACERTNTSREPGIISPEGSRYIRVASLAFFFGKICRIYLLKTVWPEEKWPTGTKLFLAYFVLFEICRHNCSLCLNFA